MNAAQLIREDVRPTLEQVLNRSHREPYVSENLRVTFFGAEDCSTEVILSDIEAARDPAHNCCLDIIVKRRQTDLNASDAGQEEEVFTGWVQGIRTAEIAALALAFQELVQRMIELGLYDKPAAGQSPTP